MKYIEMNCGENSYKLRLTCAEIRGLQKKIGKKPLDIFMKAEDNIPDFEDMLAVLEFALHRFQPTVKAEDVYDEYMDNGGDFMAFIALITDLYSDCGLMPRMTQEEKEKAMGEAARKN